MTIGFGGSGFGIGPFGGPLVAFNVVSASPENANTVDLAFSDSSPTLNTALTSPSSYVINNGISVVGVVYLGSGVVRLSVTPATTASVTYLITVIGNVLGSTGAPLTINTATFIGVGVSSVYVISGIDARTDCRGQMIFLEWTNPVTPTPLSNKILRRLKAWPFDLTDSFDVIYDGAAIDNFLDTGIAAPVSLITAPLAVGATTITVVSTVGYSAGQQLRVEKLTGSSTFDLVDIASVVDGTHILLTAPIAHAYAPGDRVAVSTPLQPQTYYYYTVLVSASSSPTTYDITDASRDFALSINITDSYGWLWKRTPRKAQVLDALPVAQGGGGGFLSKWTQVMGCWLNLMRGTVNAIQLLNDASKAPFNALAALNMDLGIDPEGYAYDFDIVRRPLTSLAFVYKRKGTCPGIVETVRMFTKWNSTCVAFGDAACAGGAKNIAMWDGTSVVQYGIGPASQISQVIQGTDGHSLFTDSAQTWDDGLWNLGTIRGWIGDIVCVASSINNKVTTQPPTANASLTAGTAPGAHSVSVTTTTGFLPAMTLQITDTVNDLAEIAIIDTLTPGTPGSFTVKGPGLVHPYPVGAIVSIQKSVIRSEYLSATTGITVVGQVLMDADAVWVQDQWEGYVLLDNSNVLHNIISSQGNTVTVDGASPAAGQYSIAFGFTLGGSFAARIPTIKYKIDNGIHSHTFEPTLDIRNRGTIYDPSSYFFEGAGLNLKGIFGPNDLGIYITTPVTVIRGVGTASANVLTLDSTQIPPTTNGLVGMFLNPNQNQEQLFSIVSNTTTTVTVSGDISSLVGPGQAYYVLIPRDAVRFQRVSARLRTEFTDVDTRVHVLFV